MTEINLSEIRAHADAATKGPWAVCSNGVMASELGKQEFGDDYNPCGPRDLEICTAWEHPQLGAPVLITGQATGPFQTPPTVTRIEPADAEFIARARTYVPALLAEVERLTAERDAAVLANKNIVEIVLDTIELERVDADDTNHPTDISYNQALKDASTSIRAQFNLLEAG